MNDAHSFYVLSKPYPDDEVFAYGNPRWARQFGRALWGESVDLESIRCPTDSGHQRPGRRVGKFAVVLPSPKVGDFTWTWPSDCLITDRVLDLFREAGFTGFRTGPVGVEPKIEKGTRLTRPPVLWEMVITGEGGMADPRSGIRLIYTCPHCNLIVYSSYRNGLIVDERNWDGSDFFTVVGYPKHILVTERVKNLIVEHKLNNCTLIPSAELQWKGGVKPEEVYGEESHSD